MSPGYRIGVDVGGTFTDIVAIDEAGGLTFLKTPSIPGDQARGVLTGLAGSLTILFFARVLDGISGASVSVAQASHSHGGCDSRAGS